MKIQIIEEELKSSDRYKVIHCYEEWKAEQMRRFLLVFFMGLMIGAAIVAGVAVAVID